MTKGQGLNGSQVAGQVETTGHKVVSSNIGLKEFSHGFLCGKERAIVQNKMQSVLEWNRMGLGIAKGWFYILNWLYLFFYFNFLLARPKGLAWLSLIHFVHSLFICPSLTIRSFSPAQLLA